MILYYTHRRFGESRIIDNCWVRLVEQAERIGQRLVAVIPEQDALAIPTAWGRQDVVWYETVEKGIPDIYHRIIKGLEVAGKFETVYLAEHDVLYCDAHFKYVPKDGLGYNLNYTYLSEYGYFQRYSNCLALSMLCGPANLIKKGVEGKLQELKDNTFKCYEPQGDMIRSNFKTAEPCVDIRHDFNQSWHVDPKTDRFWQEVPKSNIWPGAAVLWAEINN
jgi:hypothetical protein